MTYFQLYLRLLKQSTKDIFTANKTKIYNYFGCDLGGQWTHEWWSDRYWDHTCSLSAHSRYAVQCTALWSNQPLSPACRKICNRTNLLYQCKQLLCCLNQALSILAWQHIWTEPRVQSISYVISHLSDNLTLYWFIIVILIAFPLLFVKESQ